MSYDSPAPQEEEPTTATPSTGSDSPTAPETVDPSDGTDQDGAPVENPAG